MCPLNNRSSSLVHSLWGWHSQREQDNCWENALFFLQILGYLMCGMCFLLYQTENWFYQKVTGCLAPPSSSWHFSVWIILNVGFWNPPHSQLPPSSLPVPKTQLPNASLHPAASLPGSWLFRMWWDK